MNWGQRCQIQTFLPLSIVINISHRAREWMLVHPTSFAAVFSLLHVVLRSQSTILHRHAQSDLAWRCVYGPTGYLSKRQIVLRELLKIGVIEESNSVWCRHLVLVVKKDGSVWFCVEYPYPMPQVNELLHCSLFHNTGFSCSYPHQG